MKTEVVLCAQCSQEIVKPEGSCGTGYGISQSGEKICYNCCGANDKKELSDLPIGDKLTFYWHNGHLTNWPSTMVLKPTRVNESRNNWNSKRTDAWFKLNGNLYHGLHVGESHQLMTVRRIKGQ